MTLPLLLQTICNVLPLFVWLDVFKATARNQGSAIATTIPSGLVSIAPLPSALPAPSTATVFHLAIVNARIPRSGVVQTVTFLSVPYAIKEIARHLESAFVPMALKGLIATCLYVCEVA